MKLIEIIMRRGLGAYNSFRKSLLESYSHLVSNLDNTELSNEDLRSIAIRKSSSDGILKLIIVRSWENYKFC